MQSNSRRDFLSKSFIGAASFGLFGSFNKTFSNDLNQSKKENIIKRKLGKTNIEIPIVSMGVMNADLPDLLKKSYELGIRHFDTAAGYQDGRNEEMVGKVIKELGVREKVIISTKIMSSKHRDGLDTKQFVEKFMEMFNASLKRLQMKYVDILYMHSVSAIEEIHIEGAIQAFSQLKKQKKIRFAGVSTHKGMATVINEVAEKGFYDVVLTSYNFKLAEDKNLANAIEAASKKGIGIVAMKTQAGGKGVNNSAALKWALKNKYITTAIPGYTNYDHLDQNFSVSSNIEFTKEEEEYLKDKKVNLGMGFCRDCDNCLIQCPKGVEVPKLMRTYMYAAQYGNLYQAKNTLDEIKSEKGISNCNSCNNCQVKCANNVSVSKRIDELKLLLV